MRRRPLRARALIGSLCSAVLASAFVCASARAVEYTGKDYRDPFGVSGSAANLKDEIASMRLTLEGVLWNTTEPRAIVSGKIVKVGGTLNGIEILDIGREGVKMRYKGQEFYLRKRKIR